MRSSEAFGNVTGVFLTGSSMARYRALYRQAYSRQSEGRRLQTATAALFVTPHPVCEVCSATNFYATTKPHPEITAYSTSQKQKQRHLLNECPPTSPVSNGRPTGEKQSIRERIEWLQHAILHPSRLIKDELYAYFIAVLVVAWVSGQLHRHYNRDLNAGCW